MRMGIDGELKDESSTVVQLATESGVGDAEEVSEGMRRRNGI